MNRGDEVKKIQSKKKPDYLLGLFLLPGLVGVMLFYVIPFFQSVSASFGNLKVYEEMLKSTTFQNGVQNTILFIFCYVPLNLILAFSLSGIIQGMKKLKWVMLFIFMIPFAMPSGVLIYFWKMIFDYHGLLNKWLYMAGVEPVNWFMSNHVRLIVLVIFVYKNIGFNLFVFLIGRNLIPKEYYEWAAIEGATHWQQLKSITLVYLIPTFLFGTIMAVIHAFSVFKEIYMLFGAYPPREMYMLQHYITNQFNNFNLPTLRAMNVIITVPMMVVAALALKWQGTRARKEGS
jgi:multiple sugar transport system permease protein